MGEDQGFLLVARHRGDLARHRQAAGQSWHALASVVWRRQVLRGGEPLEEHRWSPMLNVIGADGVLSQVSADKLDSITAFPKFFSQTSYTKLASYRRAIFQALEASLRSMCVWWRQVCPGVLKTRTHQHWCSYSQISLTNVHSTTHSHTHTHIRCVQNSVCQHLCFAHTQSQTGELLVQGGARLHINVL